MISSRALCSSFSRYLANSTAFVQNGPKIREVPLVVRRLLDDSRRVSGGSSYRGSRVDQELLSRLDALENTPSLLHLLETLQSNEVTPLVASLSLSKLVAFTEKEDESQRGRVSSMGEGFTRHAFIKRLLDIILSGVQEDSEILMDGLLLGTLELETSMDPMDAIQFRRKMYEEALMAMTDGRLSPCQISRAVCVIAEYFPDRGAKYRETDKFWPGILDKSMEINAGNISTVCKVLPHLKKSRDIVMRTIEGKLEDCLLEINTDSVLEILGILGSIDERNRRILDNFSEWTSFNIQRLSEKELSAFIFYFSSLEFSSLSFEKSLERYVKAKGVHIQDLQLVASISEFALKFRLRNTSLLEGLSEYFISHGRDFTPHQIHSVVRTFGELNYHPPNGFKFFEILESLLEEHFNNSDFSPLHILNILVSAVYLDVYPLNFVNKVFSQGFFKRCATNLSPPEQTEADIRLRILESCIRLGVKGYDRLPSWRSGSYQYVNRNFRVGRAAKKILGPLSEVSDGGLDRINLDVVLSSLPLTPLYIIDLMIYPSAVAKLSRFGRETKNNLNTAVIIHPPEHYDDKGEFLIGSQATRLRQLKKMGFKVMELDLRRIYALSRSQSEELKDYLRTCLKEALQTSHK
eukprot:TRINITY_DN6585_c0_g1_i1.p1 TRINITY_DN6585_c0_g1~~TRINITY_DN6585_c0_g1_i1.p1  ORF type:complete len:635 (-),score=190.82 TRINITY_DN6585_c0_g1_i1:53-1957(-)